jgi:hypothetical protein
MTSGTTHAGDQLQRLVLAACQDKQYFARHGDGA